MRISKPTSIFVVTTILSVLILGAVFTFSARTQTVNDTRLTLDTNWLVPPPVTIEKMWRNHESIAPAVPFNGYEGWLQDFKVRVKNSSTSRIKYLEIIVHIPAKDQDGQFYLPEHRMAAGNNYFQSRQAVIQAPELLLQPNETVDVMFHSRTYEIFSARAKKVPPEALKHVKIKIGAVVFEDIDTAWYRGIYMKRGESGTWKPDKDRISKMTPPQKRGIQTGSIVNSLAPKRSFVCYTLDEIKTEQCRGAACGSGVIMRTGRI